MVCTSHHPETIQSHPHMATLCYIHLRWCFFLPNINIIASFSRFTCFGRITIFTCFISISLPSQKLDTWHAFDEKHFSLHKSSMAGNPINSWISCVDPPDFMLQSSWRAAHRLVKRILHSEAMTSLLQSYSRGFVCQSPRRDYLHMSLLYLGPYLNIKQILVKG